VSVADLAGVSDPHDMDEQDGVEDLVHDPVVANPDPLQRVLPLHRHAVRRAGIVGQRFQCRSDPLRLTSLQRPSERSARDPREFHVVSPDHVKPRSALFCSHGM